MMRLRFALPSALKIVACTAKADGQALLTLQCTLPFEIVNDLSETLELASRMTGSDKLGSILAAITQECRSSWLPQVDLDRAKKLDGVDV